MEDKMDGLAEAARKARLLADRVLPGRPHHLTLNPHRKYVPPAEFWFTGESSRLQYMTNVSDADRGMLLTVPYFEIMDEPETANPVKAVVRGEAKKKMSIKDYKNRKKSVSPTDNDLSVKTDVSQGTASAAAAAKEGDRSEESRPKEASGEQAARPLKPRPGDLNGDTTVPQPKSETRNPSASDGRKRPPDVEANIPPQKKLKTTDGASRLDLVRDPRSDPPRTRDMSKDRPLQKGLKDAKDWRDSKDAKDKKDARAVTPSGTANGGLQVSNDRDKDLSSPRSTILVNGSRSRAGSSTSTPRKGDKSEASKTNIPPLLSPPFQMDVSGEVASPRKRPAGKAPIKGPKDGGHSRTNSAAKPPIPDLLSPIHLGFDNEHDSVSKKAPGKSKPKVASSSKDLKGPKSLIPPILSPNLPPVVEADLARNPPPKAVPISQATTGAKKTKLAMEHKEAAEDPGPRCKVVVLKYKRALKARVQAILSLPSKSRRDALRKERSASIERTPPTRKRALTASGSASEFPPKRSRPSADVLPAKSAAPTTPLKNSATSMIRVLSNNSQANTPGDATGLTPSAAERPPTSSDSVDPAMAARAAVQRNWHAKFTRLGSKLKHTKDDIVRAGPPNNIPESDQKRAAALHFEMVLSYMIAFKALNHSRALERKSLDVTMWETLLPHFAELRVRTHPWRPLLSLAVQIHALCLEEFSHTFTLMDEKSAGAAFVRWVRFAKKRRETWEEARALADRVEDAKMRVNFGPWSSVDDAVADALRVMRRWAVQEGVDWRAELEVPVTNGN